MWVLYNENPSGRHVGDCAVRAIGKALGLTWDEAYARLVAQGYVMCDMPSSNAVFGALLKYNGFTREIIPNTCPDCYTLRDFCEEHPKGLYVVGMSGHVATVVDGDVYDAWDSQNEIPVYIWKKEKEQ